MTIKTAASASASPRQLEEPATKPEVFTDAQGNPTTVAVMDNTGVAGVYLTSEGKVGEKEAWGTRAKWATLSGNVKGEDVVIGIFDHPKNSTYPAYCTRAATACLPSIHSAPKISPKAQRRSTTLCSRAKKRPSASAS